MYGRFLKPFKGKELSETYRGIYGKWFLGTGSSKTDEGNVRKQKDLTIVEPVVTIRSTMKQETVGVMEELADALL